MTRRDHRLTVTDPELGRFWAERHLCTLTTLRADGRPHVVPVGATLDVEAGLARVITSGTSVKIAHVRRDPRVALCQVDGRRWTTVEGRARVLEGADDVVEAERRYARRYRVPRENPRRVVLAVDVERVLGHL